MLLELFLSYGSCICNLWKNIFHEISSHFLSLSTIAFSLLHHQYLVLFLSQQTNQAPSFLHTLTATSPHGFARESVAHLPSKRTSLKPYPSTPRMKSVSIAVRQLLFFLFHKLGPQFHRTPIVTPQLHCVSGTVAHHQCPSMRKWWPVWWSLVGRRYRLVSDTPSLALRPGWAD